MLAAFSSAEALSAESTTILRLNGSCSLRTKSKAPIFIASMTFWFVHEGADDDNHCVLRMLANPGEQLDAREGAQVQFRHHELGTLHAEALVSTVSRSLRKHPRPGRFEQMLRPLEKVRFLIDEEDGLLGHNDRCLKIYTINSARNDNGKSRAYPSMTPKQAQKSTKRRLNAAVSAASLAKIVQCIKKIYFAESPATTWKLREFPYN